METHLIKIGTLAKQTGLTVETLRFYEQQELISPKKRSSGGYRLYQQEDIQVVRFILQAKALGFTLSEIKELLSINLNKEEHTCKDVKSFTAEKITQVEEKIKDLQMIQRALQSMYDACCGGEEKATHCSILSALENRPKD